MQNWRDAWVAIEEREVVVAVLSLLCIALVLRYRTRLSAIPRYGLLLLAFSLRVFGYQVTVAETFFLDHFRHGADVLEHTSYTASTLLLFVWILSAWTKEQNT